MSNNNKQTKMTRFKLHTGENLPVTFFGGKDRGMVMFGTQEEWDLLWSTDESVLVDWDNCSEVETVGDLQSKCGQCQCETGSVSKHFQETKKLVVDEDGQLTEKLFVTFSK